MGKKTRATQEALGALHLATAEYFKRMLEDAEEKGVDVPAAQMGNILRFLHDNDIVAESDTQNILEDMRNKLNSQKESTNKCKVDLSGSLPDSVDYEQVLHDIEVEGVS
jgi:hypothetical protein|nr:MAG TPA: DNA packaging protein [Caudoviricetes sp.]